MIAYLILIQQARINSTNNHDVPANQSLKLTAEAEVVSRYARENELILASAPQMEIEIRIVRKYSYQRRSLAPVR